MIRLLITGLAASTLTIGAAPLHAEVMLLSGHDQLIEMGGSGQSYVPTWPVDQLGMVAQAINSRFGTDFTVGNNVTNLYTPETFSTGTYNDGEIDLLNALAGAHGDSSVTVFGVSQSAGIIGMAIHDIASGHLPQKGIEWFTSNLNPGVTSADMPQNIHWLALAPPTMPVHDHASGLFQDPSISFAWLYPYAQNPFPIDAGNADVYCGMYDPVCDLPTSLNGTALNNALNGINDVHVGYGTQGAASLGYEMAHATEFTIGPNGAVTIYPDQTGAPVDVTHFYLMPDVHNFGTAANPDYDSYLPMLAWLSWWQGAYEQWLPYDTLQVDAAYDDALHPFEYMINGTDYTFYDGHVVAVADLPAGVLPQAVSEADLSGAMGDLARQIASGAVSAETMGSGAESVGVGDWGAFFGWLIGLL